MNPTIPTLEARVRPHSDERGRSTKCLAFVELTIGGAFVIKGIKILKTAGEAEPFVVFPSEQGKGDARDRFYDVAHPATPQARAAAIALILEEYAKAKKAT